MQLIQSIRKLFQSRETQAETKPLQPNGFEGSGYRYLGTYSYTGEKNMGEIGPIREYICDHEGLRARSWQLFLDSEICQTVFKRFERWVIGNGLKMQAEPNEDVLESEGVKLDTEKFNNLSETRFEVYSNSRLSDYSAMNTLQSLAGRSFLDSIVGGDMLVILRVIDGILKVQLIDGACLGTPSNCSILNNVATWTNGNRIKHGVEMDATGKHVAYHIKTTMFQYERIEAYGAKTGMLMAYLVYGLKYRLDNVRGIPLISAVMETSSKMDRYKEATLGSAEERAKLTLAIEHTEISSGENPFAQNFAKAAGSLEALPQTIHGKQLADTVQATTNKQTVNLPQGASLKTVESKNELYFGDFFGVNIGLVCATVGIPPDVAMMDYKSNYSASRAAIKDWEHTLNVQRKSFADQFYQPIYNLWLYLEILKNKIQASGYLTAVAGKNYMVIEAYRCARWVGANVPHIDPLKEVQAERAKLGSDGAHLPLTTLEAATESLNGGNSYHNMKQFADELSDADEYGIEKGGKETDVTASPSDK